MQEKERDDIIQNLVKAEKSTDSGHVLETSQNIDNGTIVP